jgi:SAM-dependent methyltransferase
MRPPSPWLVAQSDLLPSRGRGLDLACGAGRHALWLAARGLDVTAVDRDAGKLEELAVSAQGAGLRVAARRLDLETPAAVPEAGAWDVVVVVNYLNRPLFPALRESLRPGGILIYETFTRAQALRGRPRDPAFLLEPGELARLVAPLEILRAREGVFDDRDLASVVARAARA